MPTARGTANVSGGRRQPGERVLREIGQPLGREAVVERVHASLAEISSASDCMQIDVLTVHADESIELVAVLVS
jgi:hypothetical protein